METDAEIVWNKLMVGKIGKWLAVPSVGQIYHQASGRRSDSILKESVQGIVYFIPIKAEQRLFFRLSEIMMFLEGSDVSESRSGSEIFIFN